ncbi:TPA: UDP-glucose 6-dehydrogenase, partial [Acinetobacter baumannii]
MSITISVVGLGYVGLSNAILLAQHNQVFAIDNNIERVNLVNEKKAPIHDREIIEYLKNKKLNLQATLDYKSAYRQSEVI